MRNINIIVAVDESGGFGKDGKLPWNQPDDLKHFQKVTNGSVCIMGRKTYDDIKEMRKGKESDSILSDRDCYVISNTVKSLPDAVVAKTLTEAIYFSDESKDVFIIGGERLFITGLSYATNVYLTVVTGTYDCDRFFPVGVLNKRFTIESGEQSGDLKFMVYKRLSV